MHLTTLRDIIRSTPLRWARQYPATNWPQMQATLDRLNRLDLETATKEQVALVIGNDFWTRIECDECGKEVEAYVQLGEEPDYESSTACICFPCLEKAVALKP